MLRGINLAAVALWVFATGDLSGLRNLMKKTTEKLRELGVDPALVHKTAAARPAKPAEEIEGGPQINVASIYRWIDSLANPTAGDNAGTKRKKDQHIANLCALHNCLLGRLPDVNSEFVPAPVVDSEAVAAVEETQQATGNLPSGENSGEDGEQNE